NHVELGAAREDALQEHDVMWDPVAHARIEAQRCLAHRYQLGLGLRVPRGEQGDVVSLLHELLREVGDDAFRPAVALGWNTLAQRRDLRDTESIHELPPRPG